MRFFKIYWIYLMLDPSRLEMLFGRGPFWIVDSPWEGWALPVSPPAGFSEIAFECKFPRCNLTRCSNPPPGGLFLNNHPNRAHFCPVFKLLPVLIINSNLILVFILVSIKRWNKVSFANCQWGFTNANIIKDNPPQQQFYDSVCLMSAIGRYSCKMPLQIFPD